MTPTPTKLDEPGLALVEHHDESCCLAPPLDDGPRPALVGGLSVLAVLGIGGIVLAAPLLLYWGIAAIVVGSVAVGSISSRRSRSRAVDPSELADRDIGSAYRRLLAAHGELASVLAERRDVSGLATSLLERSRKTVLDCGQLARTTNPVSHHLAMHARSALVAEADRARDAATSSTDGEVAHSLRAAAEESARHVAVLDDLIVFRDRVRARLELAAATLEAATAGMVKLRSLEDEELTRAASSDDHALEISDQLEAVTSARALCAS